MKLGERRGCGPEDGRDFQAETAAEFDNVINEMALTSNDISTGSPKLALLVKAYSILQINRVSLT